MCNALAQDLTWKHAEMWETAGQWARSRDAYSACLQAMTDEDARATASGFSKFSPTKWGDCYFHRGRCSLYTKDTTSAASDLTIAITKGMSWVVSTFALSCQLPC